MLEFLKKRWVYHSLVWSIVYLLINLMDQGENRPIWERMVEDILEYTTLIYMAYAHLYIKETYFDQRKYFNYLLLLPIAIGISIVYVNVLRTFGYARPSSFEMDVWDAIFCIGVSTGLVYLKRGIVNQFQLQELKARTTEIELNALKAQINPHFLFNTLNNIYGINKEDANKGSAMILELSELMRYHLGFSKRKLVRLEEELRFLESYIQLEELRLNNNCEIQVEFEQADLSLKIAPLILLTFVENAFKHGTHSTKPCFINMQLKTIENQLVFKIENSLIADRKTIKTNLGLENTIRRLALVYPEKHHLKFEQTEAQYVVNLSIEL